LHLVGDLFELFEFEFGMEIMPLDATPVPDFL